ncbi:MAG: hypothetical protein KGP28_13200, partial [Bdellovibrionales bacterium]|nr:hypothetical protein [Bdellovibrionales bacterium]
IGLLSEASQARFQEKANRIEAARESIRGFYLYPNEATNQRLTEFGMNPIRDRVSGEDLLKRPEVNFSVLESLGWEPAFRDPECFEQIDIQVKYQGYIEKDLELLEGVRSAEALQIPPTLDYESVAGLSNEIKGRLKEVRPQNLGQASRIQGVTPAAVANLMIFLKNKAPHRGTGTESIHRGTQH